MVWENVCCLHFLFSKNLYAKQWKQHQNFTISYTDVGKHETQWKQGNFILIINLKKNRNKKCFFNQREPGFS